MEVIYIRKHNARLFRLVPIIITIFLYIMISVASSLSLTQLAEFPSSLPSNSTSGKFFWIPIKIQTTVNVPFQITNIQIEGPNNSTYFENATFYIYDYEDTNGFPGNGYATLEKGFEIYQGKLSNPQGLWMNISEAALFILIPPSLAIEKPECKITLEYRWLGLISKSASVILK